MFLKFKYTCRFCVTKKMRHWKNVLVSVCRNSTNLYGLLLTVAILPEVDYDVWGKDFTWAGKSEI